MGAEFSLLEIPFSDPGIRLCLVLRETGDPFSVPKESFFLFLAERV